MSSIKPVTTITIAGLTGRISRLIATHILQTKPSVSINGIVRTPAKLPADLQDNPRVKIFQADSSDKDKIKDALKGSDICICGYMGGPDVMVDGQKLLIDACIEMKVPKYVASDWCIDFRDLVSSTLLIPPLSSTHQSKLTPPGTRRPSPQRPNETHRILP